IVRNPILDRPGDAGVRARGRTLERWIEHLQISQWIALHHDDVGQMANTHTPETRLFTQNLCVVERDMLEDGKRGESGLLMQLEFADQAKTVHLIDESRVL